MRSRYCKHHTFAYAIFQSRFIYREARIKAGGICRKFVDEKLSIEQIGAVVAVHKKLLLARQKAFADRQTRFLADRFAQLLTEVTVNAVQLLHAVSINQSIRDFSSGLSNKKFC